MVLVPPGETSTLTIRYARAATPSPQGFAPCVCPAVTVAQTRAWHRWTPAVDGKINEKFLLKWQGHNKLQVKMLGARVTVAKGKGKGKLALSTRFQQQKAPAPRPASEQTTATTTTTSTSAKPSVGKWLSSCSSFAVGT